MWQTAHQYIIKILTVPLIWRLNDWMRVFFVFGFDRLTPKEREYVQAMSKLGKGPYRSSEVAEKLGEDVKALGPCRAKIIAKGMIYSPSYGDIAFTVPMFEDYINRLFMNPRRT